VRLDPAIETCRECEQLWNEYARIASMRLNLIREQQSGPYTGAFTPRVSLGERVQKLSQAQVRLRRSITEHERLGHATSR
jgi:hypothetical protein